MGTFRVSFALYSLYGRDSPYCGPPRPRLRRQRARLRLRLRRSHGTGQVSLTVCAESVGVCRPELPDHQLENPRMEELPPVKSSSFSLVTRLKTLVPWAKSTKLGTLTVNPFSFGCDLMNSLKPE